MLSNKCSAQLKKGLLLHFNIIRLSWVIIINISSQYSLRWIVGDDELSYFNTTLLHDGCQQEPVDRAVVEIKNKHSICMSYWGDHLMDPCGIQGIYILFYTDFQVCER